MNNLIPEGWEQNKLGKYVGILGGNAFKSEAFTEVGIPVVRISNIKKDGSINLNNSIFANEDASFNRFKVQYGDILIAMSGATTGKVGRYALNNYSYLNQRVGKFFAKGKNDVSMDYIHQVTAKDSFVQSILIDAIGGAQPNISNQQIESIIALFPPLPEQQKIAAILTSMDEVIEKTQAQIDKLKDLKSGMMQELLAKGVGIKQGDKYEPHTEFKDSPVGRIPKSWEVLDLDQIAKVIDCKHATPQYFSDGYPVVKPGNIKEGNLNVDSCAFTDKAGFDNLNENHTPKVGDIIYSRNQTYGIGAYVDKEIDFCIGQDVCIIHPITCDSKFTYYVLNSPLVKLQVEFLAAGSTFKRINLGAIRKLKLQLPPIEEQLKIASIFESIDKKIVTISVKLKALQNTKKALMQDLLTGKVRVKVDNDLVV